MGPRRLRLYMVHGRIPCGLRTVIVIPIHELKVSAAGRIHAIDGGTRPGTGQSVGFCRGKKGGKTGQMKRSVDRYLEQEAEVSRCGG